MKVSVKNLGVLKQAKFELGELTIICGLNNTGKTYATYALYGFLASWRGHLSINISSEKINQLLTEGFVSIDIKPYVDNADELIKKCCNSYTKTLPNVFATNGERFEGAEFLVCVGKNSDAIYDSELYFEHTTAKARFLSITKNKESYEIGVSLLVEKGQFYLPPLARHPLIAPISDTIKEVVFGRFFPRQFIASAERTGAAIFRRELDINRNRLLEGMADAARARKDVKLLSMLKKDYQDYALPVKRDVDFARNLESIAKRDSFIKEKHPEILKAFANVCGGIYTVTRTGEVYYAPKGAKVRLTMGEGSSSVRSLLDIGFYLNHIAQPGDLLMVDEPELNLHPENQRLLARVFARLVNVGVKVFVTTHSDYIVKELNTLIMLSQNNPHLKDIASREGYEQGELLQPDKVKAYIAMEESILLDGNKRRTKEHTFVAAEISDELGIEAKSFDSTIIKMNNLQEEILYGE